MIKQIVLAFLGSIFPVILFNIDRKKIIWTGFSGAIGWAVYLVVNNTANSPIIASFLGTFALGIYSEIMARKLKTPAIEFSIPGIFPLVPGITAYQTISCIVNHNYTQGFSKGMLTLGVGGAIGFGLMLSSTSFRFMSRIKDDKLYNL